MAGAFIIWSGVLNGMSIVNISIFFIALLYIAGTANLYNFMDGIDGMGAITGIVGFGLLSFYIFAAGLDRAMGVLSACMGFACAGFLPFNLPKAKIFMGDVASVFLGFIFSILVLSVSGGILDFICLAAILFPFYADGLSTMFIRFKNGENLFVAHRRHLYQLLANGKWSIPHWKISLGYGVLQIVVWATVMCARRFGASAVVLILFLWFTGFIVVTSEIRRKLE
jgi:Fuc2NAc and GlcNAc transferase